MDFKNSDITSGSVIADLGSADAAVALEAAATLAVAMQGGNILPLTADGQLVLPAGVGLDDIKVVGRDLIIQMPDGTQMVVPDGAVFVPQIVVDGVAVPPLNIAALLVGQEPQPAAGRPQSSGGNFADPVGDIGDPFALGDLLPPTQLAFPEPEEREIIPELNDEEPTTIIVTPDQPAGSVSATASVNEAGLPARGTEPPGSNESSNAETTTGSIVFEALDGLASITLNGVAITAIGQVFVTPLGRLTITSIAPGNIGYSYTLTDNTTNPVSNDIFAVVVTDTDGDTAIANLTINIIDDAPTARNDTDSVPAANYTGQTGNVITGVGTTSGNAGADTQGADGAVLSGIRAGTGAGTFVGAGTTINGQYGTLTISANGSYTYTRNAGTPGGVNDVFTYQITDGDGDTSTATLTISIADSPVTITSVPTTGAGTVVDEAGLPARGTEPPGSNAAAPSESTSGTITFTAPDGIASVAINGVNITGAGQVITVPTGTLLITGYNPATGTLTYTFTLTDNTSGDATTQVFTITVTDTDGDTATSPFTVRIIDDVPTARNDSGTQATENAPVTVNIIANDTQGADGVNLATGVALVAGSLSGTGTLVYNGNGTFTYTPAPGEEGVVTFNYTITDGDGDISTATVTINLLADSTPTLNVAGDSDVNESGLPARASKPEGSDAAAPSETAVGTITVGTGSDSVASLVINGVNVTAGGTVTTALGTLVITVSGGVYSYSYTLTDNTLAATSSDTFTIVLTDSDGDTASSNLVIAIIDDAPTAVADTDSIAAGNYGPATGNVISDTEGDGGKDVQGADGVTVTNIAGAGGSGGAGTAVNGLYGVLTLNADGSYSYVRNAGSPGGVSDVFTYTITDGDGDTSTTTLTIAIADSPVSLTLPVKGAAGTVVDEAGLPAGSNAPSDSEKTSGTIAYIAADGPATVTIDGVAVTAVGQTFTGAFGTLTITSIANGVIGYEYLLTTNTSGDATFDDFVIVVTDQDGDSSNGTLVIDIVDDVPTARADVDSVTEDDFSGESESVSADGNVITGVGGSDANGTDGVGDTQGADGASVTAVAFGATTGTVGGSTAGEYGTLTLNADGSYSYLLNNFDPRIQGLDGDETLTEIFTYTITDGDGDARTTTLTITINGSDDPITINGLNIEGPELVVDDDDLPDGSSPNAPELTKTGSFTVNGVDGIASIKVGGTEVFVGQTITTASGTFTITAISSPADGNADSITISYSFTLNSNTAHPDGAGENSITESFEVVVTDTDGSTDTDFIDVRIIDDVPTAVNDTDSIAAGGEFGPATGNVITDAEGDGGADTRGADGASVTAIVGAAAGTVGGTTAGLYGVLTLNADGSYSYARNAGTPGGVSDVFTYTITDSDGDSSTATLTIAIADAKPLAGPNAEVLLDDDALTGGNAGGTGDDVDAANLTGTLAAAGGDGPLSWAYTLGGAPAGFNYVANGSGIDVFQGTTKVLAITLNTATGAYTVTQLAPIVHAPGSSENNQGFTISYNVTDTDGDASSGTLTINVDDDTPTASNDVDEILSGSNAPATGNVITDAEGDGGADSVGADGGAAIVAITGFGGAGTVGGVTNGQYGKLTINADGSYSYVRNAGTPGNVEDVFTYTLTDADGDTVTATLTISIEDARPITGLNATVLLDDDALAGGNAGGTGDDANAANLNGTLAGSGGDGALTWAYQTSGNPAGFTYVANGTGIDVFQGATKVLVITLNSATGAYSVAQVAPIVHANGGDENNQVFTINYTVTDADGDAAPGTLTINVDDDSPTATDDGQVTIEGAPAVIGNVLSNDSVGADTPGTVTLVGAAAIGANTVIVGTYGTLTISSNGSYSYVPNASVASGSVDSFTYTMRDADGDTATATLRFTYDGDANRPTAGATTASVDDDALGGNAGGTGDLPDANADGDGNQATFSGTLPLNFGLDGAGKVSFAHLHNQFVIVGTESVQLKWVEATSTLTATGPRGDLFTLVVNQATGAYTLTLLDNVLHNGGGTENDATTVLTYVVTDSDNSTAPGTLTITFDDDTPTATADTDAVTEDGTTTANGNVLTGAGTDGNVAGADSFGADGQSPLGAVTAVTGGSLGVPIVGTYGSLTLNANGSYSFVLNNASAAVQGLDSGETATQIYTYTIRDGDGDETTATLTITINGTNDAPTVNADTNWTIEDAAAPITGNVLNTVAHNGAPDAVARGDVADTDVDVETLTVTTTGAINGLYGILTLNADGSYSYALYTQAQNAAAYALIQGRDAGDPPLNDVFNYTVTDGTAPVGSTLTIAVFGANDAPVANPDSNWTVEDAAAAITGNVLNTVAHNGAPDAVARGDAADTDIDVETLTVTTTGAINGLYGILTLNADGSYSYALYTEAQNAAAYALIQGRDSNDPPLNDVFNYTVTDGTAPVGSTLTIAVFGANDAPVARADSNWTVEDAAAAITGNVLNTVAHNGAPDALARGDVADTDIDVETLTVTTTGAINGLYGILTLNANGSYSYALYTQAQNAAAYALIQGRDAGDPPLNDVFNYTVTDGSAPVGSTLTIAVFGANDAPVALADTNWVVDVATGPNPTTAGNVLQTLAHNGAPDALARGDVADTDVDVETLTVTTVGTFVGTYGTLVLNADGSYIYTLNASNAAVDAPDVGEKLFDTFNYTASDGTASAGATLTIAVFGTNDAPAVNADTNWTIEDAAAPITGNVLNTVAHNGAPDAAPRGDVADTDVDAETLTVTTTGAINGLYGILTLNADGSYSYALYTQAQNAAAYALVQGRDVGDPPLNDVFNYTATDGTTPVNSTLTIAVFGANDAPTLGTATVSVSEEGLPGANPDGAGSPDTTDLRIVNGTIAVGDVDGEALTVTLGNPGAVLTADGLAVTWTGVGTGTLIGSVGMVEVIRIAIANNGAFTVTLSQSIDHPLINIEDLKTFTVPVTVSDGTTSTTNATALTINIEDDSPIITSASNVVLTGSNLSVSGNFDYEIGADSRPVITTLNGDFTSVLLSGLVGSAAITNVLMTKTSETNTAANYTFSFQYDSDPTTAGIQAATSTGSLIFNKAGTYTLTLDQPIATFTTVTTSGTIGTPESYNLVGSAASQPEIVVSQLGTNFFVRFTGVENNVVAGGNNVFVNNETFGGTQGWVSVTGSENGVSSDTLQNGEVLNLDFYTASPGGAVSPPAGTARADTVFLKLAQLGNSEDMVVLLKLIDPDDNSIITRIVVVDSGDIWKPADGANPYGISYVGADGVIIIESNDYNFGAENYQIYGMQLLTSTNGLTLGAGNNAIDLNRNTGSTGLSTFTDDFTGTDDNDVIKIVDIGFVQRTTNTQVLKLNIDVTVKDSDGDTASQLLTVNGGVPVAPLAPLMLDGADTALPGDTMLFALDQEIDNAVTNTAAATTSRPSDLQIAAEETAAPATVSLAATDKSAEQLRNSSNVTATVIAASLVGLPAIADALAAPAPDTARLEMLPDQETAMPDQVNLVGGDDNVEIVGESGLSADTETFRITDDDDSSLQAADDDTAIATLDAQPLTPLSDGFTGGADIVDIADILPSATPMGGDAVMHNILDLAAAGLTAASNDNPVELAIENVVDEALPDTMIDRLVEAFEADADAPVVSADSVSDSSGYLVELINQSVSSSPDFATIHIDPFGSQYNDMANTNNG